MLLDITFDLSAIDSFALTVMLVGYTVVFSSLILLFFTYKNLPKILNINTKIQLKKKGKKECEVCQDITGEINAAIGLALCEYFNELHDTESGRVTIKKVSKRYSPWSSKIYGLNTYFEKSK
ncbi:MAG: OadG family protein [Bacteroidota bacterium]|nr:OadG family protein [Bacteroidota bacterium]